MIGKYEEKNKLQKFLVFLFRSSTAHGSRNLRRACLKRDFCLADSLSSGTFRLLLAVRIPFGNFSECSC